MSSVVVVGHITKDLIRIPGRADKTMPGGSAFYASFALARLGFSVTVLTKLHTTDAALLDPLRRAGVDLVVRPSKTTTVFENSYSGEHLSVRHQRVTSTAEPFTGDDLAGLSADWVHLGPLTATEMPLEVFEASAYVAARCSFDAQGVLRKVVDQAVVPSSPATLASMLEGVDVLKVDDTEAAALVGERDPSKAARALARMGPSEVLVTFADRGSLLFVDDEAHRVAAVPPTALIDATGCGDTFLAGYTAARLREQGPERAARIAAAAASLKLESYGPLDRTWDAVVRHAR
jgi:sugar/nucleoside kinase (ribokinase family)